MDLQEEAGLEREVEAQQELCKRLQSLFMSLPDPGSSLHTPQAGRKAPPHPVLPRDPALCTPTGNQGARAHIHPHPGLRGTAWPSTKGSSCKFLPSCPGSTTSHRDTETILFKQDSSSTSGWAPGELCCPGLDWMSPSHTTEGDFPLCSSLSASKSLLGGCQGEPGLVLAQTLSWEVLLGWR